MKLLMVHPHDILSGMEPWTVRVRRLAAELQGRGHAVKVVYFPLDGERKLYTEFTHEEGFNAVPFSRSRRKLLHNIRRMFPLAEWADLVHYQKCHAHASLPSLFAAYWKGKPAHYDWDDWELLIYKDRPPSRVLGWYLALLEALLPPLNNTVSVSSARLRECALWLGVQPHRLFDAPVGADLACFRPEVDRGELAVVHGVRGPVVMTCGQLHGAQYTELFLHAAKLIMRRRDEVTFFVVGGGHRLAELYELARNLNILSHTVFTGPVPHEDLPRYLALADVAVAAFMDNEQQRAKSPLKVVEYMACGKAIVASRVGEAARMLEGCGLLVNPGDVEALAEGIQTLLDDPRERRRLGAAARRRAEQCYNWKNTAANLEAAYQRAQHDFRHAHVPTLRRLARFIYDNRDIVGVLHGRRAFAGPATIQLDPTNMCNQHCLACWCNSPLLEDRAIPPADKAQTLSMKVLAELVEDAAAMGTEEIYLAGGGEPFMHPELLELVALIKSTKLRCVINTNFTLLNETMVDRIVELGVDGLAVSLWADDAESYCATRPGRTPREFERLVELLSHLTERKGNGLPHVRLYNVVFNLNYRRVAGMIALARKLNVDAVEFTVADVVPGRTEQLLLNRQQREWLHGEGLRLSGQNHYTDSGKKLELRHFDVFMRRLCTEAADRGDHDVDLIDAVPCTVGWTYARVAANGEVNSCLKSHRLPVGNVYDMRFRELWNSPAQMWFRQHANVFRKRGPFFRCIGNDPGAEVGCHRSCDNIGHNKSLYDRMARLSWPKKALLKWAAWHYPDPDNP